MFASIDAANSYVVMVIAAPAVKIAMFLISDVFMVRVIYIK